MIKYPVSVVMSVYNGGGYVEGAIRSILNQTLKNFEFIIIDDGSTDSTKKIIESFKDKRIKLISRENRGLVSSLNEGILLAKGALIARQDADDLSEPNRLANQVKIMQEFPKLVLVGTSMKVMNNEGKILHNHHVLLGNTELKQELLVRSPFAHGSVMFRKKAAIDAGMYRKEFWPAEDYDLWLRLAACGDFANINETLYVYRENTAGISSTNSVSQIQQSHRIRNRAWRVRKSLLLKTGNTISTAKYEGLSDDALRISRIYDNISLLIHKSVKRIDLISFWYLYNLRKRMRQSE